MDSVFFKTLCVIRTNIVRHSRFIIKELEMAYKNLPNSLHRRLSWSEMNEVTFSIMYHSTIVCSVGRMIDGATEDEGIYRSAVHRQRISCIYCHHGLFCVRVMHHSSNTDAQAHSWNYYGVPDNKFDTFSYRPKLHPCVTHNNEYNFVCTFQYTCSAPCGDHSGNFTFCGW